MYKAFALIASVAVTTAFGCQTYDQHRGHARSQAKEQPASHADEAEGRSAVAMIKPSKAATTQPSMNKVSGSATFTRVSNGVRVQAEVIGLTPNSKHGFHIHESGDLSAPDLSSAGGHWDPKHTGHHGAPNSRPRHAGDLGNISTDAQGRGKVDMVIPDISISGEHGVVGKSVIVHAKEDDLRSQPSGDAGGRVAGGVIEAKE